MIRGRAKMHNCNAYYTYDQDSLSLMKKKINYLLLEELKLLMMGVSFCLSSSLPTTLKLEQYKRKYLVHCVFDCAEN